MARAVLALAAAALLLPATASADTSPSEAIALLNAQRTANGIPGGITEDAARSQGCANHNEYMRKNGGQLVHDEDDKNQYRTPSGDEAGNNAVLASGSTWKDGNPWETAPIHLMQLLAPRLKQTGVNDAGGYVCATTWLGMDSNNGPASPVVYTYPGDGASNWRTSEIANEQPTTPGEAVGLPKGTRTGPYIYALLDGPGNLFQLRSQAKLTAATLTGPQGPVELRTLDSTNADLGQYMVPGAWVIPVSPLVAGTYTGSVTFDVSGTPVSRTWSFSTSGAAPQAAAPAPSIPTIPTSDQGTKLTAKTSLPSKVKGSSVSGSVTCSGPCKVIATLTAKGIKRPLASQTTVAKKGGKVKIKLKLPRSVRGVVRKAKLNVTTTSLAGAKSPAPTTTSVKFTR